MKMKYREIAQRHYLLLEIGEKLLPRKASAAIARNIVKMEQELQTYEKQRADIAERYAVKKNGEFVADDGHYTFDTAENEANFREEIGQLGEVEVDLDILKFSEKELDQCESTDRYDILTPRQEAALEWMIAYSVEEA